MIKRTVEVSSDALYLHVRNRQLVLKSRDGTERMIPSEDIGMLVLDNPGITLTTAVINVITSTGGCIVVCNPSHLPQGLVLPIEGNSLQSERFQKQVSMPEPLRKQIWKMLVQAKLNLQAKLLESLGKQHQMVSSLSKQVKSGDKGNLEAQGARIYWNELFGRDFKRDRYGDGPNALLNYGYTILRASVARSLCGSGLHPTLGVHHHHRNNAFCLADDLMEPFRPLVDQAVYRIWVTGKTTIDRESKSELLGLHNNYVFMKNQNQMVQIAIQLTSQSLAKSIMEGHEDLCLPESPAYEASESA